MNIFPGPNFVLLNGGVPCVEMSQRRGSTVIKKFDVQIQPHLNKIKHIILFLCSVVTGLPTTTKAPPPSQKWVRGKQVGEGGGGVYTL